MNSSASSPASGQGLGRLVVYYAAVALAVAALLRYVPGVGELLSGVALDEMGRSDVGQLLGSQGAPAVGSVSSRAPWSNAAVAGMSMLGALAIMVPVTWTYMVTRRHRGYDESVVHTLLILPVAVTGIVMIVQDSVALAFSLAGIVAAVRFRTTLDDTKDAVYVFLAIGVGLASGVQALGVALTLSLVFNAVVIVLWRTGFGDTSDRGALGEAALRLERYIVEERSKKKQKRANSLILVQASASGPAQAAVEPVLEDLAHRWKLAEIVPGPHGFVLEYLARLEGPGAQGAVLDRLGQAPGGAIVSSELHSLQGLKPRA